MPIALCPNPMFDHLLELSNQDNSNKLSKIEITQVVSIKVNFTHLIWSSDLSFPVPGMFPRRGRCRTVFMPEPVMAADISSSSRPRPKTGAMSRLKSMERHAKVKANQRFGRRLLYLLLYFI